MKCPNCNHDILDSAIICPFCNTQFAFSAHGTIKKSNYEMISSDMNFTPEPLVSENNSKDEEFDPSESYNRFSNEIIETNANEEEITPSVVTNELNFGDTNLETLNPIKPEDSNKSMAKVEQYELEGNQINNNKTLTSLPQNISTTNTIVNNSNLPPTVEMAKTVNIVPVAKDRIFFMCVIIVGSIILLIISFMLILGNNRKNIINAELKPNELNTTKKQTTTTKISKNIGVRSSFVSPVHIGDTTIASLYSSINNKYYDVDVYGIRFITGIEATQLGESFNKKPSDSFIYEGFEYRVKLNDMDDLSIPINPVLEAKIYRLIGTDRFNVDNETYVIKVQSIYDGGDIMNGNEAIIKVIYSIPTYADNYSICLGNKDNNIGCFTKFVI